MPLLPDDDRQLHRALELARAMAAFASPNPAVGCILVGAGQVLGRGAHRYDIRDHAEIVALNEAAANGHSVRGANAYVTLEPCSHHGRTGPCADALIAAGISRCVVATVDPNPLVRGTGITKLQAAGVEVVVADPAMPVAHAARRLNDAFAFSIQHGRPFVTLKAAVSADGKLAPPPASRTETAPHWLTGPAARADVQQLRHRADALLTGIGTVLADDPELTDRTGLPRRRPLLRVVLDSQLRIPLQSKLLQGMAGDLLVVASEAASTSREADLRAAGAEVLRLRSANGALDLAAVLAALAAVACRSVLAEGGSALNGSLLTQALADQVVLYESAAELGPDALPFAQGQPPPEALLHRLTNPVRHRFPNGAGVAICTSGYLHDPWAGVSSDWPNAVPLTHVHRTG